MTSRRTLSCITDLATNDELMVFNESLASNNQHNQQLTPLSKLKKETSLESPKGSSPKGPSVSRNFSPRGSYTGNFPLTGGKNQRSLKKLSGLLGEEVLTAIKGHDDEFPPIDS